MVVQEQICRDQKRLSFSGLVGAFVDEEEKKEDAKRKCILSFCGVSASPLLTYDRNTEKRKKQTFGKSKRRMSSNWIL